MGNKELIAALRERADGFESFNPDAVLLKRAANALEAQEWRDIESAPKDGTEICIFGFDPDYSSDKAHGYDKSAFHPTQSSAVWDVDHMAWRVCSYDGGCYGTVNNPTHWKPLTPPETE